MWQLTQSTVMWEPIKGKPVLKWSKCEVPCWARDVLVGHSASIMPSTASSHARAAPRRKDRMARGRQAGEQHPAPLRCRARS